MLDLSCFPPQVALTIYAITLIIITVACVAGEFESRKNNKK